MKTELEKEKQINLCLLKNYKNTEEKLKKLEQKYNGKLRNHKKPIKKFIIYDLPRIFSGKAKVS